MLPAFVITKLTGPAAMLACDSATLHSYNLTLTCAAPSACGRGAAPTIAPSNAPATAVPAQTLFDLRSIVACLFKGYSIESIHRADLPAGGSIPVWRTSGRRVQHYADQEDEKPEREARERRAPKPAPAGDRTLPQRDLAAQPDVAVAEEQCYEPHLGPEHARGRERVELGEHQQQAAREDQAEAADHPQVNGGEAIELSGPVGHPAGREPKRGDVRRDGETAPGQDADEMQVGDRSAHGPGVAVEVRPAGDQLGYRRHGDHGSVLLLVWATSLDRRAAAECSRGGDPGRRVLIPPGIIPARTESLSGRLTAHPEDRLESSELERFEAVVVPHLDAAYTLARYITRNDHDAQDIVQDASLRALRYFRSFRGTAVGEGREWLLAIVRNTAYTWRQRHRGDTLTTEFDEERHSDTVADEHPEAAAEAQSERAALRRASDELPPEFREGIVLRELEGLSYKEISDVAGVPVGTVMSRLSRARRRLEEALCADPEDR